MCKAVSSTLIVVVNIPFILISLILIIVGALVKWNYEMIAGRLVPALLDQSVDDRVQEAARKIFVELLKFLGPFGLAVFIFGIFLFVLTFCGIFGVCCKSKVLLGTYTALLLVMFLALLIVTIVFGARTAWFRAQFQDTVRQVVVRDYEMDNEQESKSSVTLLIDMIQKQNLCCGSKNYEDYKENPSYRQQGYQIPASCCRDPKDRECWAAPTSQNSYKDHGCFDTFWWVIDDNLRIILYILIGLLVFTFLFATIAIYLLVRYTREELVMV